MKAILTYHSVDDSGSVISVTPSQLEQHLDALQSRGVRIVPLTSLSAVPWDVDAVALTFDDGFFNFASAAAPVLISRSAPATVFILPSHVGASNDWEAKDSRLPVPHLRLMGWAEIAQVRLQGFDIGGHGMTHRSLRSLDSELLSKEVRDCAALIEERVGAAPESFAFPYGDYDEASVAIVAKTYPLACTTRFDALSSTDSVHALPRLDMYYFRGGRMLARWGSPELTAYIAGRKLARTIGNALRKRARTSNA